MVNGTTAAGFWTTTHVSGATAAADVAADLERPVPLPASRTERDALLQSSLLSSEAAVNAAPPAQVVRSFVSWTATAMGK